MPVIYGWVAPDPGAALAPRPCAFSILSWCYSAIALSISTFRTFIGSSDGCPEKNCFKAAEKLAGGDRSHRSESPYRSSGVARARLLYSGRRKARIGGTAFEGRS